MDLDTTKSKIYTNGTLTAEILGEPTACDKQSTEKYKSDGYYHMLKYIWGNNKCEVNVDEDLKYSFDTSTDILKRSEAPGSSEYKVTTLTQDKMVLYSESIIGNKKYIDEIEYKKVY